MRWLPILLAAIACSTAVQRARHVESMYPSPSRVERTWRVDGVTPLGIRYQGQVDEARLDATYQAVAECVAALPPEVRTPLAYCAFDVEMSGPGDFVVVIGKSRDSCALPGWRTMEYVLAPEQGCIDKGQDTGCPCTWRGVYRLASDEQTDLVIVADDQRMAGAIWASLFTACQPWDQSQIAECAMIGTRSLGAREGPVQ